MLRYGWVAIPGVIWAVAGCGRVESERMVAERQAVSEDCSSATAQSGFIVRNFERQGGQFNVSFDVTPTAFPSDALVGIAFGAADDYSDLAAIVRFNSSGFIDARNGTSYQASEAIGYSAGVTRQVNLAVDLIRRSYSAFVDGQPLAKDFSFRGEQANALWLDRLALKVDAGDALSVCNVHVQTTLACDSALPGGGFSNQSYPPTSPAFTLNILAVPRAAKMDGVMGISTSAASSFAELAATVRFNPDGAIDALNGASYTPLEGQPSYAPNTAYSFIVVADAAAHTYSVIGPAHDRVTKGLAFRPSQSGAAAIGNFAMVSDSDAGALTVCRPWGSGGARGVAWIHDADRYGNAGYALAVSNDRLLLSDAQRTHVLNDAGAVTQTIPHGGASATDSQGNLYLLGKFDGSYDGGTGTVYPTPGGGNAYISKYDSEFQPIYTRVLGTTANVTVSSPSADDRGDVAFVLNEAGAETAVKLAPDGSTSWSSEGPVSAVALDRGGNAALGISNSSSVTVSKVDSAGTLLWTRHFASSGVDLRGVLFDSLGDTVFWGTIQGQIEFGDTTFAMDAGENGPLALIGALSPDGAPRYVRAIDMNYIRRVVADSSGHLIIVGSHDNPFEWRLNRIDESGALMTVRTGDDLLPALPHGLSGDAAIDSAGHVYWQATIVSPAPLSYLIKFLPF